jgi:hypothetical protein
VLLRFLTCVYVCVCVCVYMYVYVCKRKHLVDHERDER